MTRVLPGKMIAMISRIQPRNIDEILSLINKTCFFTGIRFLHDTSSRSINSISVLYPLVLMATFCSGFFMDAFSWKHIAIMQLAYVASFYSTRYSIALVFWHVFFGLYNSKAYQMCVKRFAEVDKTLIELGSRLTHRKSYFMCVNSIVIFLLLIFVRIALFIWQVKVRIVNITYLRIFYIGMLRTYSEILGGVIVLSYVLNVLLVRDRFSQINALLKGVKVNDDSILENVENVKKGTKKMKTYALMVSCVKSIRWEKKNRLIQTARQVHLELIQISKKLETIFGLHLIVEMLRSVIMIVVLLYLIYSQQTFSVISVFACFVHSLKIFLISRASTQAINEANRTIVIVHEMSVPISDPLIKEEIRQFSFQMLLLPLNFTAHGFFALDFEFLRTVIAGISTYFVILIQIGNTINDSHVIKHFFTNETKS